MRSSTGAGTIPPPHRQQLETDPAPHPPAGGQNMGQGQGCQLRLSAHTQPRTRTGPGDQPRTSAAAPAQPLCDSPRVPRECPVTGMDTHTPTPHGGWGRATDIEA